MKKIISVFLAVLAVLLLFSCKELTRPACPSDRGEGTWTDESGDFAVLAFKKDPYIVRLIARTETKTYIYTVELEKSFFKAYTVGGDPNDPDFAGRYKMGTGDGYRTFTMNVTIWYKDKTFDKSEFLFTYSGSDTSAEITPQ